MVDTIIKMSVQQLQAQAEYHNQQQQEEDEQFGPLLVNVLEQHGISAGDVKKLQVKSMNNESSL